jgi:hypothetical protein
MSYKVNISFRLSIRKLQVEVSMHHRSKWIMILVLAFALLIALIPVSADSYTMFSDVTANVTCSFTAVEFTISPPLLRKSLDFSVHLDLWIDGTLVDSADFDVSHGSPATHAFNYGPLTPTTHTIEVTGYVGSYHLLRSEARVAAETLAYAVIECTPNDGRFCFAPGQAPAALYSYTDSAGKPGLKVYAITAAEGTEVINLNSNELAAIPALPEETTLIAEGSPYNIALYKLPTGAFQINVADARVAKTHVCEFRGVPPLSTKVYTIE